MPPVNRKRIAAYISRKLEHDPGPLLPWRHKINGERQVTPAEWEEYRQRQLRYMQTHRRYLNGFGRPTQETADAIWNLLEPSLPKGTTLDSLLPLYTRPSTRQKWFPAEEKKPAWSATKQAFFIVLETFVSAGSDHRILNVNSVFDALATCFSDKIRFTRAKAAWNMTEETVKHARRDILLNGISLKKLWGLVIGGWSDKDGTNPLFSLKSVPRRGHQVLLRDNSPALETFQNVVRNDPNYAWHGRGGFELLFADQKLPKHKPVHDICADCTYYNEVILGERSKQLLGLQEKVHLLFDAELFAKDYEKAEQEAKELRQKIKKEYDIDARLSNAPTWIAEDVTVPRAGKHAKRRIVYEPAEGEEIKTRRERERRPPRDKEVYFRSMEEGLKNQWGRDDAGFQDTCLEIMATKKGEEIWRYMSDSYTKWYEERHDMTLRIRPEELVRAAKAPEAQVWRDKAHEQLARYDRAHTLTVQYRRVYGQIQEKRSRASTRYLPIHTGFYRIINRRYQPTHLWPTFVTTKGARPNEAELTRESRFESYRKRWFKTKAPDGAPCDLVGYDVSSSQTQILAIFLGLDDLQGKMIGEKKSVKDILAKAAWATHRISKSLFREGGVSYTGPRDKRLKELVKTLWMRVLYGSPVYEVVSDQQKDPGTYGPGWRSAEVADCFLKLQPYYVPLRKFLKASRALAEAAYARDPREGVQLQDPFDGARFQWNPVSRMGRHVMSEGMKILVSVPGTHRRRAKETIFERATGKDGRYRVDLHSLRNMVAPCLIHMLDAYFSSLVMKRLAERGIRDFVGIHDCWLVPEQVRIGRKIKDGLTILEQAIHEASGEWYGGLGGIYKDLLKYLGDRAELKIWLSKLYKRWEEWKREGYEPRFLTRPS